MCERFHCLPDELDRQDASFIRMVNIADAGRRKEREG